MDSPDGVTKSKVSRTGLLRAGPWAAASVEKDLAFLAFPTVTSADLHLALEFRSTKAEGSESDAPSAGAQEAQSTDTQHRGTPLTPRALP